MPLKLEDCFGSGCSWDLDGRALYPIVHMLVILIVLISGIILICTSDEGSDKIEIGSSLIGLAVGAIIPNPKFKTSIKAEEKKEKLTEDKIRRLDNLTRMERRVAEMLKEENIKLNERKIEEGLDIGRNFNIESDLEGIRNSVEDIHRDEVYISEIDNNDI